MSAKRKIKAHLISLPRWFATPYFACSILLGAVLAGGINANAWIGLVTGLLVMAGGHSFNSFLDYAWTGLDRGEKEDRSAEKYYTGGQNLIENGVVSLREVLANALSYYVLALVPVIYLSMHVSWWLLPVVACGMLVTFWYSWGKFNYTQELALGVGVGPIAVLLGMFAVNPHPPIIHGLLVSVPIAIVLSFLGLALDEAPDWEANVKKGVRSIAYEVSRQGVSLEWYSSTWLLFMLIYQLLLIQLGILKPLTGLSFIPAAAIIPTLVLLKKDFRKVMLIVVALGALFCILLLIGEVL